MRKQVLMVLGHQLNPDGTASHLLRERVQAASAMVEDADHRALTNPHDSLPPYNILLLSGGSPNPGQQRSEAAVMKEHIDRLFPVHEHWERDTQLLILCEESACNTLENLINSLALLMEMFPDDEFAIEVVTHAWHAPRVLNHWVWASALSEARLRCSLSVERALRSNQLNAFQLFAQWLGNWETYWDPNRTFLNLIRRHS